MYLQIEFVKDKETKEPFSPDKAVAFRIQETGLKPEYGVSLYAANGTVDCMKGDHIILAPPYNISKEEIDIIVDTAVKVLDVVFAKVSAA